MVGRTSVLSCTKRAEKAWVIIDFGPKIKIKPTCYTLRHYKDDDCYLKYWNLLASINGNDWSIIDKHSHWVSPFPGKGKSKTFKIGNCAKYYQMFKVQMTGKNSGLAGGISGSWQICCHCFEIYGFMQLYD